MTRSMWTVLFLAVVVALVVAYDLWALELGYVPTISAVITAAARNWAWLAPAVGVGMLALWLHWFWR